MKLKVVRKIFCIALTSIVVLACVIAFRKGEPLPLNDVVAEFLAKKGIAPNARVVFIVITSSGFSFMLRIFLAAMAPPCSEFSVEI